MAYDRKFYDMYERYLRESAVRRSHDFAFDLFRKVTRPISLFIVDLGCGLGEYLMYGQYKVYVGVDINRLLRTPNFVLADYHDLAFVEKLPFVPTAFVSLFSIECFHSAQEKYDFYNRIFREVRSIHYGLVSGFFYESRRNQEKVKEVGEIESYQTTENKSNHISDMFSEHRIELPTPSKMFGSDVVEVWKIFSRTKNNEP